MEEAKWYVAHTYSGYENKVKADIEKTIVNRNLGDQIMEAMRSHANMIKIEKGIVCRGRKGESRHVNPQTLTIIPI